MSGVRIKFAKYGSMKFISHLDVLRYFQKAIRRAGLDVAYSDGFNPHQIMSFASPLGLGQTSEGEYFDVEFRSMVSSEELCERLNAVMVEGMEILGASPLPERGPNQRKETAMSQTAAADYLVLRRDGYEEALSTRELRLAFPEFLSQTEIPWIKRSKSSESEADLADFVLEYSADAAPTRCSGSYENGLCLSLLLCAGSKDHVRPEAVMEEFYRYLGQPYQTFAYAFHRRETYGELPISKASFSKGSPFETSKQPLVPEDETAGYRYGAGVRIVKGRLFVPLLDYEKERVSLSEREGGR